MSDTSLLFNFLKGRDTASPAMKNVADNATSMASRIHLSSVMSVAATATMYAGFAALGAQGVALVSALAPLVGLLALLPATAAAAGAAVGVLMMAMSGLGAALKQTAAMNAAQAQTMVLAEQRVASAQVEATMAQNDLNQARLTAAQRLRDVNLQLNRTRLDEQGAILAVADAQKELQAAQRSGNRDQIAHATLAYQEAGQSLVEVQARLADVTAEDKKRTAQGVQGSLEVQSALRKQTDAVNNLANAQVALKQASMGDAATQAYRKLSAAGRQLVDVLRALGPQWHVLQQTVQQSVFAGVGGDVKALAGTYLPILKTRLAQVGVGWNEAFRGTLQLANSAGFVNDMNVALGNTAVFWQKVGHAFAPFLDGFRQFTVVGSTFLPGIGGWVQRIAIRFDAWATAARQSGRAHEWIANALKVLSQLWQVVKNLGTTIIGVFHAGSAGPDWMPGLVAGTKKLSEWVNSPVGQGKLASIFATLRDIGSKMWAVLVEIGPALMDLGTKSGPVTDTLNVFGVVIGFVADHLQTFANLLPVIIGLFILYKTIESGAVVVAAIRIPLLIAQTAAMFTLASAMRAQTAAAQTATVAQTELDVAMDANPIGLIIIAIALLVIGFIYLWNHSKAFREFWIGLWHYILVAAKAVGHWFTHDFVNYFVDLWHWITHLASNIYHDYTDMWARVIHFVESIPGKIKTAAKGMWDGIVAEFKGAINMLIDLWNKLDIGISVKVPSWVPGFGGKTYSIPDIVPDIPRLAAGGLIPATPGGRLVLAGEGREDEVIAPLSKIGASGGTIRLVIDVRGADQDMKRLIRRIVRTNGGNAEVAFA